MENEPVDFSLLSGYNPVKGVGQRGGARPPAQYDRSFANWLVAVKCYQPHNGKLAAYRIAAISKSGPIQTREDAFAAGARVMTNEQLAKSTKRAYLYAIESYMEYLGVGVRFEHKPRGGERVANYLDQEQLQSLIRASKDYREFAILSTFIYTGARLNEVRHLDIRDLDFVQKKVHIRHGKMDKERFIPMDPTLERVLRAYIARLPPEAQAPSRPVFTTRGGGRVSDKWLGEIIRRVGRRIDVYVHPHMLRHSFASAWVENGGDVFTLQIVMGHSEIEMTRRYWHYNQKKITEVFGRAAPRL
jgi:site-specific recombinase XerD